MAKTKKLRILYNYLSMHPETHNQSVYGKRTSCGTTLCAGGATIMLFGVPHSWHPSNPDPDSSSLFVDGGVFVSAKEELGLTWKQADKLFYETDEAKALAYLRKLCKFEN